ncbi:MAG: hypothetical protein J3K34DRAFT_412017 [Monoraphidium minutum]|nr:MAG: hypothetical protein J3K34DRAFT_412017 [Monoraphidium minutum]
MADTGSALETLAAAKQRLSAARRAAGSEGAARAYALMEAQVWRELARAYAGQRQEADAALCVTQAELLDPHSADTAHVAGEVAEAAGDTGGAAALYEKALALQPSHAAALRSLGALLCRRGGPCDRAVAGSLLADALRYDAASHAGWAAYGATESGPEAERHLCHAVTLAAAAPIVSCSELPLLL